MCDAIAPQGGAAKIGFDLVQSLAGQGVPMEVLVGETYKGELARDIPVISLGQQKLLLTDPKIGIVRGLFNKAAHDAVAKLIDLADTPDTVYIVNSWSQILSPSIFAALGRVSRRVLVYAHDYFLACPNGGYFDFGREELCERVPLSLSCLATQCDKRNYAQKMWRTGVGAMRRLNWDFGRNGSKIVVVHEGMVEHLARAGIAEQSVVVVRNPSKPFTAAPIKAERNLGILYVGSLTVEKGVDVLVDALSERPWTLNLFGQGGVRLPPAPNIIAHGFQSHEIIGRTAESCRVLTMPSRVRETFGLSALEALGAGIPIIVSRQAQLSSDIETHQCGLVLPIVDKASLLEAVDELFGDDGRTAELSRRASRAHALMSPSFDVWTAQILRVCQSMLTSDATRAASHVLSVPKASQAR
ncbi:MAG: glycosyltransferase family 4 protein [Methylocella sp.]